MKSSTLGRRVAAIKYCHKTAGEASPTDDERVKAVMHGARRTLGVAPRKLAAATSDKVIGMSTLSRRGIAGKRDKAILLLGFALAARRSELVALDVEDITECAEGLHASKNRKLIKSALAWRSQSAGVLSSARLLPCWNGWPLPTRDSRLRSAHRQAAATHPSFFTSRIA